MIPKHHAQSPGSRTLPINQHPWFKKHFVSNMLQEIKKNKSAKTQTGIEVKKGTRLPEQVNILTTLIVPVRSKKKKNLLPSNHP